MKRIFDVFASLMGLILLFPVLIIAVVLIKIDSPGKIFYLQERIGLHGRIFKIFKFRSMVSDAEKIGTYYTALDDNRVTRVGKYLRKSSIDELPQLLNVFLGHMSIIGPRPNVMKQKELYEVNDWEKRNSVKPGISGLAQATVRSSTTFEERLALDIEYIDKQSFLLDIKIILLTIKQLFTKGGY